MRFIFLLVSFSIFYANAQDQIDFRAMPQSTIDFRINQRTSVAFIGNTLFTNDLHQLGIYFFDIGYKYRFNRNLSTNINYRYLERRQLSGNYLNRHLFYMDLDFAKSVNRFSLGGTFRIQNQIVPNQMPIVYNRSKINLKYRQSYYIQPFTEFEIFTPLLHPSRKFPDQWRYSLGLNYNFNEHVKLEMYYQIRKLTHRVNNNCYHVFALNFTYRF